MESESMNDLINKVKSSNNQNQIQKVVPVLSKEIEEVQFSFYIEKELYKKLKLKAFEKPVLTIFNKMDKYEAETFDEWLEESVKLEIIEELKQRWQNETGDNCVFIFKSSSKTPIASTYLL